MNKNKKYKEERRQGMGKIVVQFLDFIFKVWNIIVYGAFDALVRLPNKAGIGGAATILNNVNSIFVGVGTSLLVLFFVIGFCQETVDVKEEMRYDNIVKYLIRLCVAEYFTINSKTVLMSILKCCGNFVTILKSYYGKKGKLAITKADKKILKKIDTYQEHKIWEAEFWGGFFQGLVILIVAIIVGILIIALAAMIWYTAWSRMLNLLILIPFGSLAFATMGGAGEVGRISSTYLKKFIAVALEAVVIAVALILGTALMKYQPLLDGLKFGGSGWIKVTGHLLTMLLQAAILTGVVKSAEYIMKDMIGVY